MLIKLFPKFPDFQRYSSIRSPRKLFQRTVRAERGTAMMELAIVAPLYVLIYFGLIDIGQAIRQQIVFEQLTTNIGNIEARVAELEPNTLYTNVHTGSPTACPPLSDCPGHRFVQDQFRRIFSLHGWNVGVGEAFGSLNVQTHYVPFNINNPNSDVVTIQAWGLYAGIIPAVARNVGSMVQFPYLYDDVTSPGGGAGFTTRPRVFPVGWSGFTGGDGDDVGSLPLMDRHGHQVISGNSFFGGVAKPSTGPNRGSGKTLLNRSARSPVVNIPATAKRIAFRPGERG